MPRLEQWSEIDVNGENSLIGYVYGDPRSHPSGEFNDGHRLITSQIQELNEAKGVARTRNTTYQLGERLILSEPLNLANYENFLPRK